MSRSSLSRTFVFLALCVPTAAFAATFKELSNSFLNSVVTAIMGLLTAGATAAFFYGIARYILGTRDGDSNMIRQGNQFLLWGGISLFVMVSFWGIIAYAQGQFGFSGSGTIKIPGVNLQ